MLVLEDGCKQTGAGARRPGDELGPLIAFLPLAYLVWPSLLLCGVLMAPRGRRGRANRTRTPLPDLRRRAAESGLRPPALRRLWSAGQETAVALARRPTPVRGSGLCRRRAGLGHLLGALPPVVAGFAVLARAPATGWRTCRSAGPPSNATGRRGLGGGIRDLRVTLDAQRLRRA